MKVIIAGSRDCDDYFEVKQAIRMSGFNITEVVSGCCRGVDRLGERWAKDSNLPVKSFPADWNKHGKAAGPIRNRQMAEYVGSAGGLIAIVSKESKGTKDMIRVAKIYDLKIFAYDLETGLEYVCVD